MNMNIHLPLAVEPAAPTLRGAMEAIARALHVEIDPHAEAALVVTINGLRADIAPTRQGHLAAVFRIAQADAVSRKAIIAALSEAALWGVQGQTQRFVVLDASLALLWSPAPLPEAQLLEQFEDVVATALALRQLAIDFPA